MKVAWVLPGGVDRSGTHRVVPCLLWQMERIARAHELHVIALDQEPRPCRYRLLGAEVHNIGARPRRLRALAALAAEHRRRPFGLIHAFWAVPAGVVAAAAGRLLRRPVLLHLAGGELVALPGIGYGERATRRGRLWLRIAAAGAGHVTAPSVSMCEAAAAAGLRAERLTPGVALDRWPAGPVRARPSGTGSFRLLWVGSLNRVKDPETLLRAVSSLSRRGEDVRLDVVGEDVLDGEPARLARELGIDARVRFHGFVPHAELRPFFDDADLLLVTSRHEAGPVVALEAAVAGVPVAGSAVGLLRDWAPAAAAVVPPGDPAALADLVSDLIRDPVRRAALAAAAREFALAHDADRAATRTLELYARMTGGAAAASETGRARRPAPDGVSGRSGRAAVPR